jgi:hypothetical protein
MDAAGNTYILRVTGDSYELTVRNSSGVETKSTGEAALNEGGTYTLAPKGNPGATITVDTSGSGIGGITGDITPDDGDSPPIRPPSPGDLKPAKTITITGLAPYAQYGIKGNGIVTLYSSSPYSPIAAGYGSISNGEAVVALKSVPADFNYDFSEEPSLAEVVNLIKGFPNAWTGNGSYYIMLWAGEWMVPSKNPHSFTDANPNIRVPFSENDFYVN